MPTSKNSPGFTLIELMIGVGLAAVLVTAAYQVLVGQSRVYEAQEQTIDMQQSVRVALDFMSRELRMAGYGVEALTNPFPNLVNNDTSDPNIENGTDSLTFVGNTGYGTLIQADTLPSATTVAVYPAPNPNLEYEVGDGVDFLTVDPALGKVKLNDVSVVTITGVVYGNPTPPVVPTTLTINQAFNNANFDESYPWPRAGDYVTTQPQAIAYRVRRIVNGVVDNIVNGEMTPSGDPLDTLVLERSPNGGGTWQQLIEDVEDLQFAFAFDADGDRDMETDANGLIWAVDSDNDGTLDTQVNDDGSTAALGTPVNFLGFSAATTPIRAARVSLLVRTTRQDRSFPIIGGRPPVEDRAGGTANNDRFRRRLLRSVVKFRNMGLV